MRRAAVLAMPLLLGACSGFGKFISDTATLPGANPNAPRGDSENLLKAEGHAAVAQPILSQGGNIWPDAPQPLPTLSDVSRNPTAINDLMKSTGASAMDLPEGGSLSAGEADGIHNGVHDFSGPGAVDDESANPTNATSQHKPSAPIIIPNGDGTNTVIAPDGTVRTEKAPIQKQSQ